MKRATEFSGKCALPLTLLFVLGAGISGRLGAQEAASHARAAQIESALRDGILRELSPGREPAVPEAYVGAEQVALAVSAEISSFSLDRGARAGGPTESELEALARERDDTIFTTSARTVDFNGAGLIPRFTYTKFSNVYDGNSRKSDPLDRKLEVYQTTLRGVIGLHQDVTVAVILPYVVKDFHAKIGGKRVNLHSEGFSDLTLLGKWRFWKRQGLGTATEAALLLGAKLPTGRDNVRDGGARLAQPLQPGTGSWDGIAGAAFTRVWDSARWVLNADLFYKANTEANDYRFGNTFHFDVGGQYRVYPKKYKSFDQMTLNAILELNTVYARKDRFERSALDATGGFKMYLSPGIQAIVSENLLFESGVQIPVYRDLNGPQLAEDFRVTFGLRWRF